MLIEVKTHVYDIPRRLKEIDPNLKVFYNTDTGEYEIRGIDRMGEYILGSYSYLDQRVERDIRIGYWMVNNLSRPWKAFLQKLREERERLEAQESKYFEELDYALKDDFRWFGRTLYPGWSKDDSEGANSSGS